MTGQARDDRSGALEEAQEHRRDLGDVRTDGLGVDDDDRGCIIM